MTTEQQALDSFGSEASCLDGSVQEPLLPSQQPTEASELVPQANECAGSAVCDGSWSRGGICNNPSRGALRSSTTDNSAPLSHGTVLHAKTSQDLYILGQACRVNMLPSVVWKSNLRRCS